MVKDNKKVRFVQYKHGQLWYETECGFRFPVDTSDTGDGTFLAEDKAIIFMRYIRKALADQTPPAEETSAVKDYLREVRAKEMKPIYEALGVEQPKNCC